MKSLHANLLEPPAYLELFLKYPPVGFSAASDSFGQPYFETDFDILTTLEPKTHAALKRLPLFKLWSRVFKFPSFFLGTTITEYAPISGGTIPDLLMQGIMAEHGKRRPLMIIKDLPDASPLLGQDDNRHAELLAEASRKMRLFEVQGQALAYVPIDFASPGDYLSRLSSGRRKDIRRKLKKRDLLDIEILPLGDPRFQDEGFVDELYAMYLEVYEQSEIHFDLLSREYIAALLRSADIEGMVAFYRLKGPGGEAVSREAGKLAGYNICLLHENRLIDKYIGLSYPLARELNLYFISWMVNLEFALERGLEAYVAGWTDPEVKASLGARFTFTRHLVWVRNPILRRILYPLRKLFESDRQALEQL